MTVSSQSWRRPLGRLQPSVTRGAFGQSFTSICAVNFGAMVSFYLLFPVAPLLVGRLGGSDAQAGFATGGIMIATLVAELMTAWLRRRLGIATLLTMALLLLGLPSALLGLAGSPALVLGTCIVRGLGLGLLLVISAAQIASSVPVERRSAAFSLFGVLSSLPAILVLPIGPWMLDRLGAGTTGVLGAAVAIVGLPFVTTVSAAQAHSQDASLFRLLRDRFALQATLVLLCVAATAGICTSLLPLVHPWATPATVALGLLVHSLTCVGARGAAGLFSSDRGQAMLLRWGLAATVLGLIALSTATGPSALVLATALLGGGFGLVQNASFLRMLAVPASNVAGAASTLWSVTYDAGLGLGAVLFGLMASTFGIFATLGVIAVLAALVLIADWAPATNGARFSPKAA
jgi:predicted MFS family arabinose efflux permease